MMASSNQECGLFPCVKITNHKTPMAASHGMSCGLNRYGRPLEAGSVTQAIKLKLTIQSRKPITIPFRACSQMPNHPAVIRTNPMASRAGEMGGLNRLLGRDFIGAEAVSTETRTEAPREASADTADCSGAFSNR